MSERPPFPSRPRYAGPMLALLAVLILVLAWIYLLPLLDGTMAEELKYVIYAVFAIGVLSGFLRLEEKLFPPTA
jgi:hypothetical protein